MMQFLYHVGIQKEIHELEKRFRSIQDGLAVFERLSIVQFDPVYPKQVIAPAKLHRITQYENIWTLWKVELVLPGSGLRPNQWPRMWFAVKGDTVVFLCITSHVNNYDDEEMNRVALSRVSDFF